MVMLLPLLALTSTEKLDEVTSFTADRVIRMIEDGETEIRAFHEARNRLGSGASDEAQYHLRKMRNIAMRVNELRYHPDPTVAQAAERHLIRLIFICPLPSVMRCRQHLDSYKTGG